jgi:hypothetical protein
MKTCFNCGIKMSTVQLSVMADEIRKEMNLVVSASATTESKAYTGCDLDALKKWSDVVGYHTSDGVNIPGDIPQPKKCMEFLSHCAELRKRAYEKYTKIADEKIVAFKKEILDLLEKDESLKEYKNLMTSEMSTVFSSVNSFSSIKAIVAPYYKLKAEGNNKAMLKQLTETCTVALRLLLNGEKIDESIFGEEFVSIKSMVISFETIFLKVMPSTRAYLVHLFKQTMKAILYCIALCRFPVIVVENEKPVYFGHFLAGIVISPFFEMFGGNFADVCIDPRTPL